MTEVVNVRFRNKGKVYYFDPAGVKVLAGQSVIVETAKGTELGDCTCGNHEVDDERVVQPLRPVIRVATEEDKITAEQNRKKEAAAFDVFQQKIKEHGLDMKLVDVEYNFEGSKIMFFFTSDGRVDFRELVKDLASIFRTRIELRQIGVRDEAKMLGGLGICGRPFCCSTFLEEFQPVSIKMAKTQSLSLNPTKISGTCGRLMCCLKYEQNAYEHLLKNMPKLQSEVETPLGKGVITESNLLRQTVKVRLADASDDSPKSFKVSELGEGAKERYENEQKMAKENERKAMESIASFSAFESAEEKREDRPENGDERRQEGRRRRRGGHQKIENYEHGERREKPARAEKPDRPEKPEKAERPEKSEKPEKTERPEKRENRNRAERSERPEKKHGFQRDGQKHGKPKQDQPAPEKTEKETAAPKQEGGAVPHRRRRPRRRPQNGEKPNGGSEKQ